MPMNEEPSFYLRKIRHLSQALFFSGALNIGVLGLFSYWVVRERPPTPYCELKPARAGQEQVSLADRRNFSDLISSFHRQPYGQLITHLNTIQLVEDGYTVRDLALSSLVAFHDFDLGRALVSGPEEKRLLKWRDPTTGQWTTLTIYPGLSDRQFESIVAFAKTERWPITAQGAFLTLQKQKQEQHVDQSLVDAFMLTPEFLTVELLFRRSETSITRNRLLDMVLEGNWDLLRNFTERQRELNDLSRARRQKILLDYVAQKSEAAAYLLLDIENEFALKKLDDEQVITVLGLLSDKTANSELFALALLGGPRNKTVWRQAASCLYKYSGEPVPENWDYLASLRRFAPEKIALLIHDSKEMGEGISSPGSSRSVVPKSVQNIKIAVGKSEKFLPAVSGPKESSVIKKTPPSNQALSAIRLPQSKGNEKKTLQKSVATTSGVGRTQSSLAASIKSDTSKSPKVPRRYIVQEGDSLWKIARRFNVDMEILKEHNQLKSDAIRPGTTLKIP
jgi:LysM repeat protein